LTLNIAHLIGQTKIPAPDHLLAGSVRRTSDRERVETDYPVRPSHARIASCTTETSDRRATRKSHERRDSRSQARLWYRDRALVPALDEPDRRALHQGSRSRRTGPSMSGQDQRAGERQTTSSGSASGLPAIRRARSRTPALELSRSAADRSDHLFHLEASVPARRIRPGDAFVASASSIHTGA